METAVICGRFILKTERRSNFPGNTLFPGKSFICWALCLVPARPGEEPADGVACEGDDEAGEDHHAIHE